MWCLTCIAPPEHLALDQGTDYISDDMKHNVAGSNIQLTAALLHDPSTICIVERYDAPLRAAYYLIQMYVGHATCADDCLAMDVHAVNPTFERDGLCPNILMFGAIPCPPARIHPLQSSNERNPLKTQSWLFGKSRRYAESLSVKGIPTDQRERRYGPKSRSSFHLHLCYRNK